MPLMALIGVATGGADALLAGLALAGTPSTLVATAALSSMLAVPMPTNRIGSKFLIYTTLVMTNLVAAAHPWATGVAPKALWVVRVAPTGLSSLTTLPAWVG